MKENLLRPSQCSWIKGMYINAVDELLHPYKSGVLFANQLFKLWYFASL